MLRTLPDVRLFILDQPAGIRERQLWQRAWELLLAAAEQRGVIEGVTRHVETALFFESRLVSQAVRPTRPR
jgi:ABC-type taurine transport system ATPase subunit